MKKKLGIILLVAVSLLGLQGVSRKPSTAAANGSLTVSSLDDRPGSRQRAMYFAPGGTLTINEGQATFKPAPVRE